MVDDVDVPQGIPGNPLWRKRLISWVDPDGSLKDGSAALDGLKISLVITMVITTNMHIDIHRLDWIKYIKLDR